MISVRYKYSKLFNSVQKIISGSFKNVDKICLQIIYSIYMFKHDLALNNLK